MLTRLLDWYFSSDNPNIAAVREFVRGHTVTRRAANALLRIVRGVIERLRIVRWAIFYAFALLRLALVHPRAALALLRAGLYPVVTVRDRAIMRARALGGSLSIEELQGLWIVGKRARRIFCIAAEPEFRQMEGLLRAARRFVPIGWFNPQEVPDPDLVQQMGRFDLIVIAGDFELDPPIDQRTPPIVVRLGRVTPLSEWGYRSNFVNRPPRIGEARSGTLKEKLKTGEPISVLFFNDVGFQYGAGNALRRQAASFLLNGWNVRLAAWTPGSDTGQPSVTGISDFENWHGVVPLCEGSDPLSQDPTSFDRVVTKIDSLKADVIITGNLHGTDRAIEILPRLRRSGAALFAYMHDTYWVTGRCAQPGMCTLFRTGCTSACPTAGDYPRLSPELIAAAWQARAEHFTGSEAIPLIANSRWTQGVVKQRFGAAARSEVIHLALDHHLFSPLPKSEARRCLGLPEDKTLVLMGAVDVRDRWKGGPLFQGVHGGLTSRDDVGVVLFGLSSQQLAATKAFGLVDDERFMPLIMSACDIFVSCAIAESFGQTLLEASACGLPVVAFNVGGVSDIVVHQQTGLLIDDLAIEPMLAALETLIGDPSRRGALGQRARERVEEQFTLVHQARAWVDCIQRLC